MRTSNIVRGNWGLGEQQGEHGTDVYIKLVLNEHWQSKNFCTAGDHLLAVTCFY